MTELLVLLIDGADGRIVDELVAVGRMPAIAALQREGAIGHWDERPYTMEESRWPMLLSGRPSGDIGLMHYSIFDPKTMGLTFRREWTGDAFWTHLPDKGRGALVLDAPETHIAPESLADQICGWHVVDAPHPIASNAPQPRAALKRLPRPPRLVEPLRTTTIDEERANTQHLIKSAALRARTIITLGRGRGIVTAGVHELHMTTHWSGHQWDPHHWGRPPEAEPEIVFSAYDAVDRLLGDVIAALRPRNTIVVMTRGIDPNPSIGDVLTPLLERAGLLIRPGSGAPSHGASSAATANPLMRLARTVLPAALREAIATKVLPRETQHKMASSRFRDEHDWTRTRALVSPTWGDGLIRANVAGRERFGIVPPNQLEDLLISIETMVRQLRDADTGRALVADVLRTRTVFPGFYSDSLPDLVVVWNGGRPAARVSHPQFGEWTPAIEGFTAPFRATRHHGAGRAVLSGDAFASGVSIDGVNSQGLAATILSAAGVRRGDPWSDVLA